MFLSLILCQCFACSHPPFSKNYIDKKGNKKCRWEVFYDYAQKHLFYKGKFKNNKPRKMLKYYFNDGYLMQTEKYFKNGKIETIYFYKNGKVELKGNAELIVTKDSVYYNWIGQWQKYDSLGKHIEEHTYIRGKRIWVRKIE